MDENSSLLDDEELVQEARDVFGMFDKVATVHSNSRTVYQTYKRGTEVALLVSKVNCLPQDGDGNIPTQELGTAMRALGTFPKVSKEWEICLHISIYPGN